MKTHAPVVVLQESLVQVLLSLHCFAGPGTHWPEGEQVSPSVHALPSLHWFCVLGVKTQAPVVGLQESLVQVLLSLHCFIGPVRHRPLARQWSPSVQALSSVH